MIVAQDRSSYDRQIRIGSNKVVRELFYKVKQFCEGCTFDLHRYMLRIEYNTMLVIIYIRRILESPLTVVDGYRYDSVVLSCRMVQSSCVAFVFHAKQTFWIGCLFCQLCCCDGFRIFFRFGQVDGNIQITVFCRCYPFHVFCDTVTTDIIGILTEFVMCIGSLYRIFFIQFPEATDHIAWTVYQKTHNFCVKQVAITYTVFFHQTMFICIVTDISQNAFQFTYHTLICSVRLHDLFYIFFIDCIHLQ